MNRGRRKKIIVIAILLILLLLLGALYWNYRASRRLGGGAIFDAEGALQPPEYLYSFSGPDGDRLVRPLGVLVDGDRVLVADGRRSQISVFTRGGDLVKHFGTGQTVVPLYIAKHPKTGEYWITDRRRQAIEIFDPNGTYLRDFDPKLPAELLPKFETKGRQWAPIALAFAPDGSLYATDVLGGHRLVVFGPDGTFERAVGTVGDVAAAEERPDVFFFPNSIKVFGDEVWVADSNNGRFKVFTLDGDFIRLVKAQGLPRGIDFLPRLTGESDSAPRKFVAIDTLAHDGTIWAVNGDKLLTFGERGFLEGQFAYPNDVSIAQDNAYIFVADTANARIQVWGWPAEAEVIPTPKTAWQWALCGVPFLPLLLLPFFRKKRFFATLDFIDAMLTAELANTMPHRRRRWQCTPDDHEAMTRDRERYREDDLDLTELFEPVEHSESDAQSLMERLEIEYDPARFIATAQRAHVFCTMSPEYRRLAKVLDLDVVDRDEFLDRFAKKRSSEDEPSA